MHLHNTPAVACNIHVVIRGLFCMCSLHVPPWFYPCSVNSTSGTSPSSIATGSTNSISSWIWRWIVRVGRDEWLADDGRTDGWVDDAHRYMYDMNP